MRTAAAERGEAFQQGLVPVEIWPVCEPFWDAFSVLSRGRGHLVGHDKLIPSALLYTEVAACGKDRGFTCPDDLAEFVELVYVLDQEFLRLSADARADS